MKRVIVNADDLGRTEGINEGIFRSHRSGVVTSATLMVNYPSSIRAAEALALHPELGVGLHVALTGDQPRLPASEVASLVDGAGRFAAKPEGFGLLDPSQVRAEVRAQHEHFVRLVGREPTHLDSHHHSHRHPVVLDSLVELALEIGCPVRSTDAEMRRQLRTAGVPTTDRFDDRFFDEGVTAEMLASILDDCVEGVTEIMCHPGLVDQELMNGSSYTDRRLDEFELLTRDEVFEAFRARGLERVDFTALAAS